MARAPFPPTFTRPTLHQRVLDGRGVCAALVVALRVACFTLVWQPVLAQPAAGTPQPVPVEVMAVLPVEVKVDGQPAASRLLNSALATQLGRLSGHRIIGADEVEALLENEARLQGAGCDDAQCLAELAGALGARLVVTGELLGAGTRLMWTASVVDQQQAVVTSRATVTGPDLSSLHAQADDLALQLLGRGQELLGTGGARRLGLGTPAVMAQFQAYRDTRAAQPTDEALTGFLTERNQENTGLAAAQTAAFLAGGTCLLPSAPLLVASLMLGDTGLGLGFPLVALACGGMLGAVLLGGLGLVLVVVDALDVGHVKVRRTGCCRRDAELRDNLRVTPLQRGLALATALVGPLLATMSTVATVVTFVVVANTGLGLAPAGLLDLVVEGAAFALMPVAGLCALGFCGVSAAAGVWLLAMPQRSYLEDEVQPTGPTSPAATP